VLHLFLHHLYFWEGSGVQKPPKRINTSALQSRRKHETSCARNSDQSAKNGDNLGKPVQESSGKLAQQTREMLTTVQQKAASLGK